MGNYMTLKPPNLGQNLIVDNGRSPPWLAGRRENVPLGRRGAPSAVHERPARHHVR